MPRKVRILIIAIPLAIILLAALLSSMALFVSCLDTNNYFFDSYGAAEAETPNFAKYSWPSHVSRNATDIHAQTHSDVFNVWMRFRINSADAASMVLGMKKLSAGEIRSLSVNDPWRVDWWFDGFVGQGVSEGVIIDADVYVDPGNCETTHDTAKDAYIALDRNSDTGYYWCSRTSGRATTGNDAGQSG